MSERYAPDRDDFENAKRYVELEAPDPLRAFVFLESYGIPGGEVYIYFAVDAEARPFYVLTGASMTNLYPADQYETTEEVAQVHADVERKLIERQGDDDE